MVKLGRFANDRTTCVGGMGGTAQAEQEQKHEDESRNGQNFGETLVGGKKAAHGGTHVVAGSDANGAMNTVPPAPVAGDFAAVSRKAARREYFSPDSPSDGGIIPAGWGSSLIGHGRLALHALDLEPAGLKHAIKNAGGQPAAPGLTDDPR